MKTIYTRLLALMCAALVTVAARAQSNAGAVSLQCEHLVNPLGVDALKPRFTWQMPGTKQGAQQTAYELQITDAPGGFDGEAPIMWSSGKVASAAAIALYTGAELAPFKRYYWRVKLWDAAGQPLAASAPAYFETGMMHMTNWTGTWISDYGNIETLNAPYFRKKINLGKKVQSARAYIVAAGLYELSINGKKIGNHRLDPMYTRFDRRNLYVTYDVTAQLTQGDNVLGVILGNGWYNHQPLAVWNFDRAPWRQRPTFCMDVRVTYTDGSTEVIGTNDSWQSHSGPLVYDNIYTGEHYDANKQIPGWNTVNFDDKGWRGTGLRATPSKNIVSQTMVPIRAVDTIATKKMVKFSDTDYLFDMGQNMAGVTHVRIFGDSGTVVKLTHGERLYKPGTPKAGHLDMSNIDVYYRPKDDSQPFQADIITLNGKDTVDFTPKFNYKGFQFVEVTSNNPISLNKNSIEAYFMHSDVKPVGGISSSNPLIDNIWKATNASYLSNLYGYPTDCPQREKNGWTGDGHFAVETGLLNFDSFTVYAKWMADHRDEQQPNGVLPDIVPTGGWGYGSANGTDWTSTIVLIPWNLYLFYGDTRPLEDNYAAMKAYVGYVDRISPTGLTTFGRGDWVPVKTSSDLQYTSSVYFFADATIVAKVARILGHDEEAKQYEALAQKIKKAINDKFYDATNATYDKGTQTELSMALLWNLAPQEQRSKIAETLAKSVAASNMHLDVGVLGARAILTALSDNGQAETAYKLAAQDTYPSWGWWIVNGATTLYENWNIDAERDISLNHMMFGEVGGWFYKGLGGIHPDENAPGFKNVILKPSFVSGLKFFNSWHEGPYGKIISNWRRSGKSVIYEVTLPANSGATVYFPAGTQKVTANGKAIANFENGYAIPAGKYKFVIK